MIALLLAGAGVGALAAGAFLLNRGGPGYRVGRLLAAAPELSLQEVRDAAHSGKARYVRTHGRISSDEEFPDENDRPLVYRRQRLQRVAERGGFIDVDDERLAVPFGLEDRGVFVALDVDALGEGLVVVPRVAEGTAAELPPAFAARVPDLDRATRVRLRVEQVSAVEQATAAGVPGLGPDGLPRLSSGLGRPLILTPLEPDAAMRVLAAERRSTVRVAAALLVGGLALLAVAVVAFLAGA
jgi:hypothetical protein